MKWVWTVVSMTACMLVMTMLATGCTVALATALLAALGVLKTSYAAMAMAWNFGALAMLGVTAFATRRTTRQL